MRVGLPVVASRVGGVPELVVHEVTGLLVQAGSVHEMASALRRLHETGVARSYGRAGHERVRRIFTREAMLAGYDKLFRSLLAARTSALSGSSDR
jgi:glycosyltransferase involved in cell wall biosynthesis